MQGAGLPAGIRASRANLRKVDECAARIYEVRDKSAIVLWSRRIYAGADKSIAREHVRKMFIPGVDVGTTTRCADRGRRAFLAAD